MIHDDDALDRALAALPLEEPPANLHARIMAATVYRPRPVVRQWELWLLGTFSAVAVWLTWILMSTPRLAERVSERITDLIANGGLASTGTLLWLGIGISAAWWLSQLSVPARRSIRIR
ncbi:MAG TPA: hypothetical protein VGN14_16845 [Candidatus Elarobacter sp.]|jgi:hypothetical protein